MAATRFIILLRAVNVGGRTLSMAALRAALAEAGLPGCETYIQSGNLLLESGLSAPQIEEAIERLILDRFGLDVPAIARSTAELATAATTNPFADATSKLLHLCLAKHALAADAVERLRSRCAPAERVAAAPGGLWIDYGAGVARSKLTPAVLDRAAGSTVTARNLNTVRKLLELAGASGGREQPSPVEART